MAERNVIIIGSGPAGLTAALYSARANLKPLVIEGLEAGGQLMLTTLVENWPGHRDGIMGPDLMAEMRAQAERFGAEIIRGNVDVGRPQRARRSWSRPPMASIESRALIIATGASARLLGLPSERALHRPRRLDLRHLRRLLLPRQADRRRRRRRLGDGRGDLPDPVRVARHRHPSPRHAARVEDHAGQGVRQPEDLVRVEHRGRGHQGCAPRDGDGDRAAQQQDRRAEGAGRRRRVRRHRPHAEHVALPRPDRDGRQRLHR